jgi:hypothetical protein
VIEKNPSPRSNAEKYLARIDAVDKKGARTNHPSGEITQSQLSKSAAIYLHSLYFSGGKSGSSPVLVMVLDEPDHLLLP